MNGNIPASLNSFPKWLVIDSRFPINSTHCHHGREVATCGVEGGLWSSRSHISFENHPRGCWNHADVGGRNVAHGGSVGHARRALHDGTFDSLEVVNLVAGAGTFYSAGHVGAGMRYSIGRRRGSGAIALLKEGGHTGLHQEISQKRVFPEKHLERN